MVDLHAAFMAEADDETKASLPPGTYFYAKDFRWNMLDRIFVSPNLLDGRAPEMDLGTYRIHAPPFMTAVYEYDDAGPVFGSRVTGIPKKYNFRTTVPKWAGYSDHFPLLVRLSL